MGGVVIQYIMPLNMRLITSATANSQCIIRWCQKALMQPNASRRSELTIGHVPQFGLRINWCLQIF